MGAWASNRWWLLVEAGVSIFSARLALALIPFRRLTPYFERPARVPELTGPERTRQRDAVRRAILAVRWRAPAASTCLHRAIAAQAMLRRRGINATLYYGASRRPGHPLSTHAWVQDGAEGVIGYATAQRDQCVILAAYPAGQGQSYSRNQTGDDYEPVRATNPNHANGI
jgi:hypothetical protein